VKLGYARLQVGYPGRGAERNLRESTPSAEAVEAEKQWSALRLKQQRLSWRRRPRRWSSPMQCSRDLRRLGHGLEHAHWAATLGTNFDVDLEHASEELAPR